MSVNPEVSAEIGRLTELYESRWGKPLDCVAMPESISQEMLALILSRIVNTGERIMVGWSKVKGDGTGEGKIPI